jgi:hypothetical protein
MAKQFEDVSSARGAPMGRASYGALKLPSLPHGSIELFKVRFVDGDYDDGGAYWGGTTTLYCARSDCGEYREFVRAESRTRAQKILGIRSEQLKRKEAA